MLHLLCYISNVSVCYSINIASHFKAFGYTD